MCIRDRNKTDPLYEVAIKEAQTYLQKEIAKIIANKAPLRREAKIEKELKLSPGNAQAKYIVGGELWLSPSA